MRYAAVIDMGSTAVRLSLMEMDENKGSHDWKILEQAEKHSSLGLDIFQRGKIKKSTIEEIISHIKGFLELTEIYKPEDIFLLGSFAIREAQNREILQDRILMETGLSIRVLGGTDTNQLRYLALSQILDSRELSLENRNFLIVDIRSSSTEVMYLKQGKMTWADTLQVGVIRDRGNLGQSPDGLRGELGEQIRLKIRRVLIQFAGEYDLKEVNQVILMGREILSIAPMMGIPDSRGCYIIQSSKFLNFIKELEDFTPLELMDRFGLNFRRASGLMPALYIGVSLFELTGTEQIIVPPASALDGIFVQFASSPIELKSIFKSQILSSAWSLARHYHIDEKHAEYVREKALQIYDYISEKKKLKMVNPILLEAAAILHDIGGYISSRAHHKHSKYLVENATLFGLNSQQKALVAQIVRYHRKAKPSISHKEYMDFPRETRVSIQQLAAILRVADALDRSHTQHIHFSLTTDGSRLVINCHGNIDRTLEISSLNMKGDLFEDIYGLKVLIN